MASFTFRNAGSILALFDNSEPDPCMGEAKARTASYSSGGLEEVTDIQLTSATPGRDQFCRLRSPAYQWLKGVCGLMLPKLVGECDKSILPQCYTHRSQPPSLGVTDT